MPSPVSRGDWLWPPVHLIEASTPESSTKRSWSGSPSAKPGAQECFWAATHSHPASLLAGCKPNPLPQFPHLSPDPTGFKGSSQHNLHSGLYPPPPAPQATCWWLQRGQEQTEPGLRTLPCGLCSVTAGHSTPTVPTPHVYCHRAPEQPPPRADIMVALGATGTTLLCLPS